MNEMNLENNAEPIPLQNNVKTGKSLLKKNCKKNATSQQFKIENFK